MSSSSALELLGVKKSFGGNFCALDSVDMKVRDGEFVCIVGPSGCGKTVLLYLIAGFLSPTAGDIFTYGKKVESISSERLMVFQDHMLFPWKTVLGNVLFGLSNSELSKEEKRKKALYYLEMVGLGEFKDWPIYKLSGGMKQRVAFARSLVVDPDILLMDEPFSALDSQTRRHLRNNLLEIWDRNHKTILFVTHSVHEALCLADTIYVVSSRPFVIKKKYELSLARPRQVDDPTFIRLMKEIEAEIDSEFKIFNKSYLYNFNLTK
ncbi:MAG: ABC transporter ATP-binding protein [Candidatus Magasanikbacteria bacterium]